MRSVRRIGAAALTTVLIMIGAAWVAPPSHAAGDGDGVFTFAVMPDTQHEVLGGSLFSGRTAWLASNKTALDLRFVAHSGDLINWDTPDHAQLKRASAGMTTLEKARIPYTIAIGNHDTDAVTVGGSAKDPKRSAQLVRGTKPFNSYFTTKRYAGPSTAFERGKVDNLYTVYRGVEGAKFMVLTLELWPRPQVVAWARTVVAKYPDTNIIVVTHSFLNANGTIGQTNGGYGSTSPQYLWDQLISRYSNIKIVVSGHTGTAGAWVKTGRNGNKVYTFLNTFHARSANPVRLFTVDTRKQTLSTRAYAPATKATYPELRKNYTQLKWILKK